MPREADGTFVPRTPRISLASAPGQPYAEEGKLCPPESRTELFPFTLPKQENQTLFEKTAASPRRSTGAPGTGNLSPLGRRSSAHLEQRSSAHREREAQPLGTREVQLIAKQEEVRRQEGCSAPIGAENLSLWEQRNSAIRGNECFEMARCSSVPSPPAWASGCSPWGVILAG